MLLRGLSRASPLFGPHRIWYEGKQSLVGIKQSQKGEPQAPCQRVARATFSAVNRTRMEHPRTQRKRNDDTAHGSYCDVPFAKVEAASRRFPGPDARWLGLWNASLIAVCGRTAKPAEGQNHSLPAAAGITRMARIKLAFLAAFIGQSVKSAKCPPWRVNCGFSAVLGSGRNDKRFGRKAIDAGLIQC